MWPFNNTILNKKMVHYGSVEHKYGPSYHPMDMEWNQERGCSEPKKGIVGIGEGGSYFEYYKQKATVKDLLEDPDFINAEIDLRDSRVITFNTGKKAGGHDTVTIELLLPDGDKKPDELSVLAGKRIAEMQKRLCLSDANGNVVETHDDKVYGEYPSGALKTYSVTQYKKEFKIPDAAKFLKETLNNLKGYKTNSFCITTTGSYNQEKEKCFAYKRHKL